MEAASSVHAVRRRKHNEEVAARIEEMIRSGEYVSGDQLPSERELTAMFEVGRPAVREALFALSKMGLVTVRSGERARVTEPTPAVLVTELSGAARHLLAQPDGVRHFQGARMLFEVGLARHAADHASGAEIGDLGAALAANKDALGNGAAFHRTDVAFHYVLAVIPKNPIFTAVHAGIIDWLTDQRTTSARVPGTNDLAYRAHKRIFEAIEARDADLAEQKMREHLDEVARQYWQAVRHAE